MFRGNTYKILHDLLDRNDHNREVFKQRVLQAYQTIEEDVGALDEVRLNMAVQLVSFLQEVGEEHLSVQIAKSVYNTAMASVPEAAEEVVL
jgi:hypothetical protein